MTLAAKWAPNEHSYFDSLECGRMAEHLAKLLFPDLELPHAKRLYRQLLVLIRKRLRVTEVPFLFFFFAKKNPLTFVLVYYIGRGLVATEFQHNSVESTLFAEGCSEKARARTLCRVLEGCEGRQERNQDGWHSRP